MRYNVNREINKKGRPRRVGAPRDLMQEVRAPTQQNCAFITLYLFSMPISRGICESWKYRCNVKRCLCTTLRCRDYTLRRFIYLSGAAQRQKKLSAFALDRRRDNNMYADTRALLYMRRHCAAPFLLIMLVRLSLIPTGVPLP